MNENVRAWIDMTNVLREGKEALELGMMEAFGVIELHYGEVAGFFWN